jgi:dihydroorotate dehydrogenase
VNLTIRNAAGTARTLDDVVHLCDSAVTDIVVGTFTWNPRRGNSGQTTGFNEKEKAFANAMNMPNVGFEALLEKLPLFVKLTHRSGKKLIVSVAGECPEQYGVMAVACYRLGADGVEYNFGCPNSFEVNGVQNPIPSHAAHRQKDWC